MTTRKILVCTADRAERGLLDPVITELKKQEDAETEWCELDSHESPNLTIVRFMLRIEDFHPDIIVVPTDRNEMVYIAAYAFHNRYVVAHFHAGNNLTNHPDDLNRRAISLFSHLMLCNMPEHKENLIRQGEEPWRIHIVGSTAFDIPLNDSVTPKEPFDLIILHPDPTSKENTERDLRDTLRLMKDSFATRFIWIGPNHDKNYEVITDFLTEQKSRLATEGSEQWYFGSALTIYDSLPRPQFLSLLKHCHAAIGNSSSFYYELSVLNPQAQRFQIGARNKGLIIPKTEVGGSKRIAELLASIELTEQLRNKKLTT